jgi:hypothetical protein
MWYDVRYWDFSGPRSFMALDDNLPCERHCLTPANALEEAIQAFKGLNKNASPRMAIPLKHEWDTRDKDYWFAKWRDAVAQMPTKTKHHIRWHWEICDRGTIPLPEFIKERAKGRMQMAASETRGHPEVVIKKIITKTPYEYGRIAALAIILGYITTDGVKTKRPRANCCALMRKINKQSRPRCPKKRELLAKIPTMSKDEISILLKQGRTGMKKYHGRSNPNTGQ